MSGPESRTLGSAMCREFDSHRLHFSSVRADHIMNGCFGSSTYTSGTPEICLVPAGMADKNQLVLYPLC